MSYLALNIIEILHEIFSYTDKCTQARAARVCRIWSNITLNRLWYDLPEVRPLFALLGPIRKRAVDSIGHLEYSRRIVSSDWERFHYYAPRIHELLIDDSSYVDSILDAITSYYPSEHLLPNLTKLRYGCGLSTVVPISVEHLFLHAGLKMLSFQLTVHVPKPWVILWKSFLANISELAPNLFDLELTLTGDASILYIEKDLISLLQKLENLQTISLPRYSLTSSITSVLAKLPKIATIRKTDIPHGRRYDVAKFKPQLDENSFPSLHEINFYTGLDQSLQFLQILPVAANLIHLDIGTIDVESFESIHRCVEYLPEACPSLNFLRLNLSDGPLFTPNQVEIATFHDFESLLRLRKMKYFHLCCYRPLVITEDGIKAISESWPDLEELFLNPHVLISNSEDSLNDLNILQAFIRHLPNLSKLGLYVDATQIENLSNSTVHTESPTEIYFGNSPITDFRKVAQHLFEIYPNADVSLSRTLLEQALFGRVLGGSINELEWFSGRLWDRVAHCMKSLKYE